MKAKTEVSEKAKRRRFTAEYKAKIVREADRCTERGELGALLRREGLYSSHLAEWRAQLARVGVEGLKARKRGPKARVLDERDRKLAEQEREIAKLKKRAERAEAIVDFQKKVSTILGIVLPESEEPQ